MRDYRIMIFKGTEPVMAINLSDEEALSFIGTVISHTDYRVSVECFDTGYRPHFVRPGKEAE